MTKEKGMNNVCIDSSIDLQVFILGEEVLSMVEEDGDRFVVSVTNEDASNVTQSVIGQSNADRVLAKLLKEGNQCIFKKIQEMFYLNKAETIFRDVFRMEEETIFQYMNNIEFIIGLLDHFREWEFDSIYGSGPNIIMRMKKLLKKYGHQE